MCLVVVYVGVGRVVAKAEIHIDVSIGLWPFSWDDIGGGDVRGEDTVRRSENCTRQSHASGDKAPAVPKRTTDPTKSPTTNASYTTGLSSRG